jgi:thiol-disulfide isomerase/thioredoxin
MKKSILVTAVAGIILWGCARPDGYRISGQLEGVPDSTIIEFVPVSHQENDPIISATVINNRFEAEGRTDRPCAVRMRINNAYGALPLIIENTDITINCTATMTGENGYDGKAIYSFDNAEISGSELSTRYRNIYAIRDSMDRLYMDTQHTHRSVIEALNEARESQNGIDVDSIMSSDAYKKYMEDDKKFLAGVSEAFNKAVLDNKHDFFGPLVMLTFWSFFTPDQRPLYDALSEEAQNSYYGQMVKKELYPAGAPGDLLPDFSMKNDTSEISFHDVCAKNKCVILDFWASWCIPCKKEMPNLKEIYKRWQSHGLEIVSISIDDDNTAWVKAVENEGLIWNSFRDMDKSISELYNITAVPCIYIVDKEARLVKENIRGEDLKKEIEKIMTN